MARKRHREEVDHEDAAPQQQQSLSLLERIRNKWEFACIGEFVYLFGDALHLDKSLDVEALEEECLKPGSPRLTELGLALLKYLLGRGNITLEQFDELTRKQYVAKASENHPFGEEDEPNRFADFEIFVKLRVLHQLSVWCLVNPEKIRERVDDKDQTEWRMEAFGWDAQDRTIYLFDDDRLYRWTDAPPPQPPATRKAKAKPKKAKGSRASKRRKTASGAAVAEEEEDSIAEDTTQVQEPEDDGLGGAKWECLAVTLQDYRSYMETIQKSRDPDEKALHSRITEEVIPIVEKKAEAQERKALKRQKELENLEKLAFAKRSSRIAGRAEKQREIQEAEEAERKRKEELIMARKELERQRKIEEARESRMMTREQRIRDREMRRILREEELAQLEASSQNDSGNEGRMSERRLQVELAKRQKELEELKQEEEEEWYFDCSICGVHGHNLDDGTHIVACEKCNVWQHSSCHGIAEADAERDDFHFLCSSCRKPPKAPLLKVKMSPDSEKKQKKNEETPKKKPGKRGRPPKHRPAVDGQAEDPSGETPRPKKSPKLANGASPSKANGLNNGQLSQLEDDFYVPPAHGRLFSWQVDATSPSTSLVNHEPSSPVHNDSTPAQGKNFQPIQFSYYDTPHNPYLNDFGRQQARQSPNASKHQAAPILSPSRRKSSAIDANSNNNRPTSREASTPQHHHLGGVSFANSPTPSLSATQGNTEIRFSPSHPSGSPGNSSYAVTSVEKRSSFGGDAAIASLTLPAVTQQQQQVEQQQQQSALAPSPTNRNSQDAFGDVAAPSEGEQLRATVSVAARSPTKQRSPSSLTTPVTSFHGNGLMNAAGGGSPGGIDISEGAPVLSPSPGAEKRVLEPPKKKDVRNNDYNMSSPAGGGSGGVIGLGIGLAPSLSFSSTSITEPLGLNGVGDGGGHEKKNSSAVFNGGDGLEAENRAGAGAAEAVETATKATNKEGEDMMEDIQP